MAQLEIVKLKEEVPLKLFSCGNSSIDIQIKQSYYPTILQHASAFQISTDKQILGYYMLKFLKINIQSCPENISDYYSEICNDLYSVHIKYLAVDSRFQNKGIGTNVLGYIIKAVNELCIFWPIRLITLDALKEKYDWYRQKGFQAFQESDLHNGSPTICMYMDCLLDIEAFNEYINI